MKRLYVLALIAILMVSCSLIFENDISHTSIDVITPKDSVVVRPGKVKFAWRGINSAIGYQLIVVSPSFKHASKLVVDTLLLGDSIRIAPTSFECVVDSINCQWSIRAFNSAYSTKEQRYDLIVDSR